MLIIPDNTVMEEHTIIVDGDVILGNYAQICYGITAKTVVIGEHAKINGSIIAENDVHIDMWSEIIGDVFTKTNAYISDFVTIDKKLTVSETLDIGANVKIKNGYEVKGNVIVKNQLPFYIFIYYYILSLFGLGNKEKVKKNLERLFLENKVMIIPDKSKINLDVIETSEHAIVGNNTRLVGNIRSLSVSAGHHVILFGSMRTKENITIGSWCNIHGNIDTKSTVTIGRNNKIFGKVSAKHIVVHETSKIDGGMVAQDSVKIEKDNLEGLNEIEIKIFYGFTLFENI